MIILFVILSLISVLSIKPLGKGQWNTDYMSKDMANVIKGICIWLVFIRHISSYMSDLPCLNMWDNFLYNADLYVRQLLVVPFLFYSGYGVTISIIKKGEKYANNIPTRRVLPTLVNFDIAVFIFLIMNVVLGFDVDLSKTLLAFTGWESIRNSNWYIFCILICYLISWASYKLSRKFSLQCLYMWIGIVLYTAVLYFFKGHWWYDTIYAYGAGFVFAYKKDQIDVLIRKHYKLLFCVSVIGFLAFYNMPNFLSIPADITAVFLCMIIVVVTNRIKLENKILSWSGQRLFPIYIYQRLPMVVLSTIYGGEFVAKHHYLYIICCLIVTVFIAWIYRNKEIAKLSFSLNVRR